MFGHAVPGSIAGAMEGLRGQLGIGVDGADTSDLALAHLYGSDLGLDFTFTELVASPEKLQARISRALALRRSRSLTALLGNQAMQSAAVGGFRQRRAYARLVARQEALARGATGCLAVMPLQAHFRFSAAEFRITATLHLGTTSRDVPGGVHCGCIRRDVLDAHHAVVLS